MKRVRLRRLAAIGTVMLVVSGCGASLRSARRPASTSTPVSVGKGLLDTSPPPAPARPRDVQQRVPPLPLFVLQLTDHNGRHPQGIPVRLSGAQNRTVLSDAAGEVKITEPGTYSAMAPVGCHHDVFVLETGRARFGVVAGHPSNGALEVSWQHRVAPAPPVFADRDGDWPVGRKVTVTFAVGDRCSSERVPGGDYASFFFAVSPNMKLDQAPRLRADERGNGRVVVSCTRPGKIDLVAIDRSNPSDKVDLFAYAVGYSGVPRCKS
jgi:hypothetical protein